MVQTINGCALFPANHILNTRVDSLPVHPESDVYIAGIGGTAAVLFPAGWWSGISGFPYALIDNTQPFVPIVQRYPGDPGPYPIPPNAPMEAGTDKHVLVLNTQGGLLYEMFLSARQPDNSWHCNAGQIVDVKSNQLRPLGANGVDAAGLPMLPLLIRYDEAVTGAITHAIRVVVSHTQNTFLWPARYQAGIANPSLPPMGLRLRLKASVDLSTYTGLGKVILQAMKLYGLIVADNAGNSNIFVPGGSPDTRFNLADISQLKTLTAANFEAVDESGLMVERDSAAASGAMTTWTTRG